MKRSFAVEKIILQRREKIFHLEETLKKTVSSDVRYDLIVHIKEDQKDIRYFENMTSQNLLENKMEVIE